jgi:hypothetical protein
MYKPNDLVVVFNQGTYEIGAVIESYRKKRRTVYDVMLERGVELIIVPLDTQHAACYIDTALTQKVFSLQTVGTLRSTHVKSYQGNTRYETGVPTRRRSDHVAYFVSGSPDFFYT